MKKILVFVLISMFIFAYAGVADPFRLNKLNEGLNNVVYGAVETPDNINKTNSKGAKAFPECTDKTKDDVGRAIVRIVGGAFQIATFWYPKEAAAAQATPATKGQAAKAAKVTPVITSKEKGYIK